MSLLQTLETYLESAITAALIPGTMTPCAEDAANVAIDRRDWRRAEDLLMKLEGCKPRRPGKGMLHPPFPGKVAR